MARIAEQDYEAENKGPLTGRQLRAISSLEVQQYNLDYERLVDGEVTTRVKRVLENGREYAFELTRHVMQRANQAFGGSVTDGDEIGLRLIRPDDMEMGVAVTTGTADSWQFLWDTLGTDDIFGTAANTIGLGDTATAESLLIVGWSTDHPSPKTEAIQPVKFTRDLFVQPLPWDAVAAQEGGVKVIEANPYFAAFPGETFRYQGNIFALGDDVLRTLGVFVAPGTELRTI